MPGVFLRTTAAEVRTHEVCEQAGLRVVAGTGVVLIPLTATRLRHNHLGSAGDSGTRPDYGEAGFYYSQDGKRQAPRIVLDASGRLCVTLRGYGFAGSG